MCCHTPSLQMSQISYSRGQKPSNGSYSSHGFGFCDAAVVDYSDEYYAIQYLCVHARGLGQSRFAHSNASFASLARALMCEQVQ